MVLSVKNLNISFENKDSTTNNIIENVSFDLKKGKISALIGESGSGKSTISLAILRLLKKAKIDGKINLNLDLKTQNILDLSNHELEKIRGNKIGIVFQDASSALNPLHKIRKQIVEAIKTHNPKISRTSLNQRVEELIKKVGLKNQINRLNDFPHQFSGGQKQRFMIAIALANNPDILIMDEPTTALDTKSQNEILSLVLNLKNELNLAILFITHNLKIVKKIADEILVLKGKKIIEKGSCSEVFENPKNDYVKKLIEILNANKKRQNLDIGDKKILRVKNLSVIHKVKNQTLFSYSDFYANQNINFDLKQGENLGIIGESGSGKSTLAKALMKLIKSQGEILIDLENQNLEEKILGEKFEENYPEIFGKNAKKSSRKSLKNVIKTICRKKSINESNCDYSVKRQKSQEKSSIPSNKGFYRNIQIVFQDPFSSLNPRFLVKDIISEGLIVHGFLKMAQKKERLKKIEEKVDEIMTQLNLDLSLKNRYPHELSGGQRQRVAISRALILRPKILILDEATSALDFITSNQILEVLSEIQAKNDISYIVISHDLSVIERLCERVLEIKNGRIK